MNAIDYTRLHYFAGIILAAIYCLFFIIERQWPLRKSSQNIFSRIFINLSFTVLVVIVASALVAPAAKFTIEWTQAHEFGLLSLLPPNKVLLFIIGFLLMDLTFYYWHRLNHEIPLLWRFHNVHHADPDLDVTTSMRFHMVEIAYSVVFRLIQLGVIGINHITFFCYEFVFQANTFFQHSNIKLPLRFERILNKILVTPRMHGIHHSDYRDETNRNYSVVFSFWDRLHGTIKLNVPQKSITTGVPGYRQPSDNHFLNLLFMPFEKQRQYWKNNHLNRIFHRADNKGFLCE